MNIDSGSSAFEARRRALEEAFFQKRDQELLEKLRGELSALEESRKLAHVSGIVQEKVLMDLVKAGLTAETLAAVVTIPMVEVAWADGAVSASEKAAVLNAAAGQGIHPGTAPHDLLERWLVDRPDSRIVAAWKEYVRELAKLMPAETIAQMHKNVLDRCVRVAEAAGGFVGIHRISKVEQATIDDFANVFKD
ncbi:MAG TPA: hypothetical protein VFV87_04780 [Pirellulaceae bacterium]|nr:hypothetical protein [Pirellulaceae bacterium]